LLVVGWSARGSIGGVHVPHAGQSTITLCALASTALSKSAATVHRCEHRAICGAACSYRGTRLTRAGEALNVNNERDPRDSSSWVFESPFTGS
jgi:hypothetical protein